jgi:S-formylglutathione hydrolase FrmB
MFKVIVSSIIISGAILFQDNVIGRLISVIISIGLDPLRSQFIASLIMVAAVALVIAALSRHQMQAIAGAGVIFWFGFLNGFIQTQLQPAYDPGGHLEPLNNAALWHTSLLMMALALLSAFIGAAIGANMGIVLFDPLYLSIRFLWRRFASPSAVNIYQADPGEINSTGTKIGMRIINKWLAAIMLMSLVVLAINSTDLFLFSPDVEIHNKPNLSSSSLASPMRRLELPKTGTIIQDSLVSSALAGQRKPFLVYLPPSYNTAIGKTKRYPTLYLLHGSPGGDSDWVTGGKAADSADTLIATNRIPELIMIFPDGNGSSGATSEWGNSGDQHQLIETYVVTDLVKYVDNHYRSIANAAHRAIGGLSMGGFGAMNIAIHHPDVFGSVISLGGYYRAEGTIWGSNADYLSANSPLDTISSTTLAWKLHIFLGAATKDQPYYTDAEQFIQELNKLHIPYRFDLENGDHAWNVWQKQMYFALIWLKWGNA